MQRSRVTIGIRREDKNLFERRTPVVPDAAALLLAQKGIGVTLQPAPLRVFSDEEYRSVGAELDESLTGCATILGVKEIPPARLLPSRTYAFFSHTIKGQPHNMPMLRRLLELGCSLVDYERIVDDHGRRLVFFGRYAGLAGMIDTLWSLGQRLAHEGLETPLATLEPAHRYGRLAQAKLAVQQAGDRWRRQGIAEQLVPLVFGFAGYGNVSAGAQEILDLLEPIELSVDELRRLGTGDRTRCYKVVFREEHLVERRSGAFDLQHYYANPDGYRPVFAERYLDRLAVLVNAIYWSPRYPRLVTLDDLRALYAGGATPRLRVIGDISCDVDGAVQATVRATEPNDPVYVYDLDSGRATAGITGRGPVILAVDNLPAELPREASEWFSRTLVPFIPALAAATADGVLDPGRLCPELARAAIVAGGRLTPEYAYLTSLL